jgi:hypothetical protein
MAWLKVHQNIDIAGRGKVLPKDRSEQGQLTNGVLLAELHNLIMRDPDRELPGSGHCLSAEAFKR